MRNAFADEMVKLARNNSELILLSGDIGNKLFDEFKELGENRFINCGIAESNMMSVASGLALSGLRPVIYTIAPFTTTRCYEQIRVGVSYHRAPVTIIGTGSGLSYAELGATHHSLEDLAIMRALPDFLVLAPCDEIELRILLAEVFKQRKPAYIRIGKKSETIYNKDITTIKIGKPVKLRDGEDGCIIAAGTIMSESMRAAEILQEEGISISVVSNHTIKPLDEQYLFSLFIKYQYVFVIEEHGKIGGLGSAISEWLASQNGNLGRLISIGTDDSFMHVIGSQNFARRYYGIDSEKIATTIRNTY